MEFVEYLKEQAQRHPSTSPQDVVKLCYQAAFGAEHMLTDLESARRYLTEEYGQIAATGEPLWESIHSQVCRINLGAWKRRGMPVEWLFGMFAGTAAPPAVGGEVAFREYLRAAESLLGKGVFRFDREEWDTYLDGYTSPRPVHHSEGYRREEAPAYRLVSSRFLRILPILEILGRRQGDEADVKIVAIDGRCASGKSTMAGQLADITGAGLVHMDDFFLPIKLRTRDRLQEPGGNVHYERVLREVIPKLDDGEAFSYGRFDCGRMEIAGECRVPAGRIRIVEGVYSCHPALGEYMDIRVFSDVEEQEQLKRIRERDGEMALESFRTRWIPLEESYFAAFGIREKAELSV